MTVLRDISYLWSILHVVAIFLLFFEPRYSWRTTLLAGFAGAGSLLIVNVMAMFWLGHGIIMSISFFTCTLPTLLLFFLLSKYRDGRFFFLFCLSDTTCFWLLQITNFFDRLTGDTYVVLLIGRLIVFPVAELFFWRYLRQPYLALQKQLNKGWWWFAATGAIYYLLFMFTSVPVDTPMPELAGLIRIVLILLLMPLTYITIFNALWRQMQIFTGQQQLEMQQRDYEAIQQKMELSKIYRHDMRHHLLVLEGILQQGDNAKAQDYVNKLSGRLNDLSQTVWCGNAAVNAVLAAYSAQAAENQCPLQADVHIPTKLPYSDMALCVVLGNTLENAINACQGIPKSERWINLKIDLTENQRLIISISNACPQPVAFGYDGLPVSTPTQDNSEHGLGLRSVKSLVERHGGLIRCQWEDGRFLLWLVLFPQNEKLN